MPTIHELTGILLIVAGLFFIISAFGDKPTWLK